MSRLQHHTNLPHKKISLLCCWCDGQKGIRPTTSTIHRQAQHYCTMPNQSNTFLLPVVSSFLLGVAATLTASFVVSRLNGPKASSSSSSSTRSRNVAVTVDHDSNNTDTDNNTRQIKPTDVLDSPDLDLRLIRKAEAVIQFRSGNLTVVVERATNSFNHSAILRTAEALVRAI